MKKFLNIAMTAALIAGMATPAAAQSVAAGALAAAPIAAQMAAEGTAQGQTALAGRGSPSGRALVWTGAALFVGGMGTAIYGFLNNKNGEFPEFGEATATDKRLGGAGLGIAFAGGALMAIGHRFSRIAPDVQASPDRFAVSKRVSW